MSARRLLVSADLLQVDQLIRQLSSSQFQEREQASRTLVAMGPAAHLVLRRALSDPHREVAGRANKCMEEIWHGRNPALPLAAVRLLVERQPEGVVEELLRFLPYAADEEVEEEICFGLDSLTKRQGKVSDVLLKALDEKLLARRAGAACIVGRRGDADQQAAARRRLADDEPMVRIRAAQGLLGAKDEIGVPALVALLDEPSVEISWQAEELLHWVAGDQSPKATIGAGGANNRKQCREAWRAWWDQHGPQLAGPRIVDAPAIPRPRKDCRSSACCRVPKLPKSDEG